MNGNKVGLIVGGFLGLLHFIWSILVALGWAQSLVNFSFYLHMIAPVPRVEPFNFFKALSLVVIASIIGYLIGRLVAAIWNMVHQS